MILIDSFPNLNLCVQDQICFLNQCLPSPPLPSSPCLTTTASMQPMSTLLHTNIAHRRIIHPYPSGGGAVSSPNQLWPPCNPWPPSIYAERLAVMTISATMGHPPGWIVRCGPFHRQAFGCFPNFRPPLVSSPGQRFLLPGCVRVSSEPSDEAPSSNTPPSTNQPTSLAPSFTEQTSRRYHHQLSRPPPTPPRRHPTAPLCQYINHGHVLANLMKAFPGMFCLKPDKHDTLLKIVFGMVFAMIMGVLHPQTIFLPGWNFIEKMRLVLSFLKKKPSSSILPYHISSSIEFFFY